MATVAVTLLGDFAIRADGEVRELHGQKDQALLAVLALAPGTAHSRDKLAGLLWSDRGDPHARDSLKHALARLRPALGTADDAALVVGRQSVRLEPSALAVDVAAFERLLGQGTAEALEAALALYRGDLLDGISVHDQAFQDWLLVERQRLRGRAEAAAAELMNRALAEGETDRAATAAQRLAQLDPLREDACRTLMQRHADRGETARALRLYEALRERLLRELDVQPERETARLSEAIRESHTQGAAPVPSGTGPPPLPDRPSIAVLPFPNLSGDPEQEYFADGIVEEIITALSRMRWLFVIARNSSFTYKGRAVDVKQVGRELGVRYVLEGSVRAAAGHVRITGRLIDAAAGVHLWADSFDGGLEDIFELQDQVTARVVGAIAPELEKAEIERARRKPTASLDAYDYFLRGMAEVHKWKCDANAEALRLFGKAIELDPGFAAAWGMSARCISQRKASGWVTDHAADVAEVRRYAWRAAELGPDDALALATAGIGLAYVAGDLADGGALLALNPNLAMTRLFIGWANVWSGEPELALTEIAQAMRLSPHDPQLAMMQAATAWAHFFAGRDAEAVLWAGTCIRTQPGYRLGTCILAASQASRGDAGAADAMQSLRRIDPALRISNLRESFPILNPEHFARLAAGLRRAGLPE